MKQPPDPLPFHPSLHASHAQISTLHPLSLTVTTAGMLSFASLRYGFGFWPFLMSSLFGFGVSVPICLVPRLVMDFLMIRLITLLPTIAVRFDMARLAPVRSALLCSAYLRLRTLRLMTIARFDNPLKAFLTFPSDISCTGPVRLTLPDAGMVSSHVLSPILGQFLIF